MRAALALLACAATALSGTSAAARSPAIFFDDFGQADTAALAASGWTLREAPGHPGVPGARWSAAALSLVDDPQRPGNRLLRLTAQTDGTPAGTVQAQVCQARKFLRGTYAARVRFTDTPLRGADGDPVVQTFYAVSPLKHDFDPDFSEIDWEYLPNGGWGSPVTRLYGLSWQTVRIEPWQSHNSAAERPGSWAGWRTLVMQVGEADVRLYVDGRFFARHAGRALPVQPMALQFNLWFSPGGLGAPSAEPRVWVQEVDWVLHLPGQRIAPRAAAGLVQRLRALGVARRDTVPAPVPPLDSPCNL